MSRFVSAAVEEGDRRGKENLPIEDTLKFEATVGEKRELSLTASRNREGRDIHPDSIRHSATCPQLLVELPAPQEPLGLM